MPQEDFFIVGIGASAGGIEALKEFFRNLPDDPGIALVVIQHLNPEYPSKLSEILQRTTSLKIQKITGGEPVLMNHAYIIPEGKEVYIKNRKLFLADRIFKNKKNTSINFFFKSLAADVKEKAIGVILSGTGTDGLEGVKLIEKNGGIVMVQDPETANFSGMPENTIHLDHPSHVLPPEKLPAEIIQYTMEERS